MKQDAWWHQRSPQATRKSQRLLWHVTSRPSVNLYAQYQTNGDTWRTDRTHVSALAEAQITRSTRRHISFLPRQDSKHTEAFTLYLHPNSTTARRQWVLLQVCQNNLEKTLVTSYVSEWLILITVYSTCKVEMEVFWKKRIENSPNIYFLIQMSVFLYLFFNSRNIQEQLTHMQ